LITMSEPSPAERDDESIAGREYSSTVLGSDTHWWEYGPAAGAVTMIAVHGFRGDHHGLEPIVRHLPGIRVISPDLPGFGESAVLPGRGHDVEAYAEWLIAFAAQLGLERTNVLGHSFGSIVVAAAVTAGLAADRLILINPIAAPALRGPRAIMTRLAILYYRMGAVLPERLGQALLRSRLIVRVMSITMAKTRDRQLRSFIHDQHDQYFSRFASRDSLLEAFRTSVSHDVREYAAALSMPTLLIAAERDDISSVAAQQRLHRDIAESTLVIIPEVGHLIHYETPAAAAAQIVGFLEGAH